MRQFRRQRAKGGYVYVISERSGRGAVKVGVASQHPEKGRLAALQTGNPYKLYVYRAVWVTEPFATETAVHKALQRFRMRSDGEWFKCEPAIAAAAVERAAQPFRVAQRGHRLWSICLFLLAVLLLLLFFWGGA